jgi:hypothetical protein
MKRNNPYIRDLFQRSNINCQFKEISGYVIAFNEIDDLTSYCSPSIRRWGSQVRVDYAYGITVPFKTLDRKDGLLQGLAAGRWVSLPRTIPKKYSLDMFVTDNVLSEWLKSDIEIMLQRFTLPVENALTLVRESEDRLLANFRTAYRERFTENIINPLLDSIKPA